jgi:hypothetical protein
MTKTNANVTNSQGENVAKTDNDVKQDAKNQPVFIDPEKVDVSTDKDSIINTMLKAGKQPVWIAQEQTFDSGLHKKVFLIVEVKQLLTGLNVASKLNLISFWLRDAEDNLKLGSVINAPAFKVTLLSKIKYFEKYNSFAVINTVATENLNLSALDADCKNPYVNTHKQSGWYGSRYCLEPTTEETDKFLELAESSEHLKAQLVTATRVIGFNYNKLFVSMDEPANTL